jgi:hypothetical protein
MRYILLVGAAFNLLGAFPLARAAAKILRAPASSADRALELMLFTAGTAVVFGSLYLYLFFNPHLVMPLLLFGIALKLWALVLASYLYAQGRASKHSFMRFGMGNGIVAALFIVYLVTTQTSG